MSKYLDFFLDSPDAEQIEAIHKAYDIRDSLTNEDVQLSMNVHIVVCYDYIQLEGDYGFHYNFESTDAKEYFSKMKDFSGNSLNTILDTFDYTYHFHKTPIRKGIKRELAKVFGNKINYDDLVLYHFALYTQENANRLTNIKSPRVHFLIGRYGMIYILFYDPYHELC